MQTKAGILMIAFAIVMMIGSGLVTFFLVKKNESALMHLKVEVDNKQFLIKNIWDNINDKSARIDTLVLLEALSLPDNQMTKQAKDIYLKDFPELNNTSSITDILSALDKEKSDSVERINNFYIEQTADQKQIADLERQNKLYTNLSIFLQLLAILLITLKREIFR